MSIYNSFRRCCFQQYQIFLVFQLLIAQMVLQESRQEATLASTQIPGLRNKEFFKSCLNVGMLKFNIAGFQDSGDLKLRLSNNNVIDRFIGEDFFSVSPNGFIVVGDGVSPVHSAAEETPYLGVYPYGLLPGLFLEHVATTAQDDLSAIDVFQRANSMLDSVYEGLGLVPYVPHNRGGACFAIAKFGVDFIEIIGGGDTYVLWELADGSFGWFKNQVSEVEQMRIKEFNQQLAHASTQHGACAQKFVWSEEYYGSYFKYSRDQYTNNPNELNSYALLDGAPLAQIKPLLQYKEIDTASLKWLAIATDGCFPVEWCCDMKAVWERVQRVANQQTSLETFYSFMRQDALDSLAGHTKNPELTFLLIKHRNYD